MCHKTYHCLRTVCLAHICSTVLNKLWISANRIRNIWWGWESFLYSSVFCHFLLGGSLWSHYKWSVSSKCSRCVKTTTCSAFYWNYVWYVIICVGLLQKWLQITTRNHSEGRPLPGPLAPAHLSNSGEDGNRLYFTSCPFHIIFFFIIFNWMYLMFVIWCYTDETALLKTCHVNRFFHISGRFLQLHRSYHIKPVGSFSGVALLTQPVACSGRLNSCDILILFFRLLNGQCARTGAQLVDHCNKKVLGLITNLGIFACMGFYMLLQLPPTYQKHDC